MTKEERTVTIVRVDPWRLKSENYGNKDAMFTIRCPGHVSFANIDRRPKPLIKAKHKS
jgi:hypothetical protein